MANVSGTQTATVKELEWLRSQINEVASSLHKQQAILRLRAITLPPEVLTTLPLLDSELERLQNLLQDEEMEISLLRTLARTSALINSSLEVDAVLARAMDELIELTGAERGFILLMNDETNQLEFRIARGIDQNTVASSEVSRTILNDVLTRGQPILTDNAAQDKRLQQSETIARFALRSVMCVPLIYRNLVNGAIYVDNRFREGVFDERELNLVTAFANQASVAIDNALLVVV